jgi:hypothetical protein
LLSSNRAGFGLQIVSIDEAIVLKKSQFTEDIPILRGRCGTKAATSVIKTERGFFFLPATPDQ